MLPEENFECDILETRKKKVYKEVKVAQWYPIVCNSMDYIVHGILQARILEWIAVSFSRGIFPMKGLNPGLPHCRHILYQLNHQGSSRNFKKEEANDFFLIYLLHQLISGLSW